MFYTYVHTKATTGEVFYVGKGTKRRAWVSAGRNIWWKRTAELYGFVPKIIRSFESEQAALDDEKELIAMFRDFGVRLVNIEEGGLPGPIGKGNKKSEPHKMKISKSHLGKKKKKHSLEAREKARNRQLGVRISEEGRLKISEANRKRVLSEETRAKISATKLAKSKERKQNVN